MALQDCRWFKEGATARVEDKPVEACPYGGGSPKAILWQEGYNADPYGAASVVTKIEEATALLKRDPDDLPEIAIES